MPTVASQTFSHRIFGALLYVSVAAFSVALCALPLATQAATTLSKPPNNLGLVGYWSFDEGTGTKATDFSSRGNTGTLSGSTLPSWTSGKRGETSKPHHRDPRAVSRLT